MKRLTLIMLFSVTVALSATGQVAMQDTAFSDFYEEWIVDRLELGIRFVHFGFTDAEEQMFDGGGTFIGGFTEGISIDALEEKQDYMPVFYARWWFHEYFGIELGWERLEGETDTYWDGHTDGNLFAYGPTLLLVGSYRMQDYPAQPYAGLGVAYLFADFDDDPWDEGIHNIKVDDTTAFLAEAGCTFDVYKNLKADLALRYMWAEVDSEFYLQYGEVKTNQRSWAFPIDNWAVQLGLLYAF